MAYILNVEIAEPQYRHSQASIMERMLGEPGLDARTQKLVRAVYRGTAIQERHSALPDFDSSKEPELFFTGTPLTVEDRMQVYYRVASALAAQAGQKALDSAGIKPEAITHFVVCSCTGLQAPGVDVEASKLLGLKPDVERLGLYFIGCHAALKAIRMANHICRSEEKAVVLIIAVELCSIHMTPNQDEDSIMANALFADGAAACVMTAQKPESGGLKVEKAFTRIIPQTSKEEMAWSIASTGFLMRLSSYIPEVLSQQFLPTFLQELRQWQIVPDGEMDWLLHPGGRRILDALSKEMDLPKAALEHSYRVLENYGNMSSPTILYVLREYLASPTRKSGRQALMVGFGPGLTAESVLLSC